MDVVDAAAPSLSSRNLRRSSPMNSDEPNDDFGAKSFQ